MWECRDEKIGRLIQLGREEVSKEKGVKRLFSLLEAFYRKMNHVGKPNNHLFTKKL